ncbi:hypothetical protein TRM7557_00796 [Tritonibacter multivorans]|uniref:DUF4189 domain-containing protein n=1 Tax=Tritonibacter multivorans TaxID=928856 RepID=A0A0P1G386_9RHOB|nr:hypothetical protein [Tritonibacter multivorans]MDA7422843.1 hypothetical protein [Tritonibacter multivorans]CUH76262.1 hypothetical protein TRM7557_00796 [Tritonibacter multivorans]SFD61735.1 hypothetical protein SAMN04488049_11817 [Tritonibacter multivorans]
MTIRKFLQLVSSGVILALPLAAGAQTVDVDARGKQLVLHQDVDLTRKQQRRLDRFLKKADFYGALAANVTDLRDEAFGAAWNKHSLKAATSIAMDSCRHKAKTPSDCVLLATVVPENRTKLPPESQMLSARALREYEYMLLERLDAPNAYFAMATNMKETWAWRVSEKSLADAKTKALQGCRENVKSGKKGKPSAWDKATYKAEHDVCRIRAILMPR